MVHMLSTRRHSFAQGLERQTEEVEGGMLLWRPAENQSLLQTSLGLQREIKHQTISQSNTTICLKTQTVGIYTDKYQRDIYMFFHKTNPQTAVPVSHP